MTKDRLYVLKDTGFHPDRILDVGAHVGSSVKLFKEIWPYTDILSIDANPYVEEELKKVNPNYKIAALSDKAGEERDFFVSTEWLLSSGNSLYRENTPSFSDDKCKTIKVTTQTLGGMFNNGETFDFIKLDTQGAELDIIMGGLDLVKKAKYILTETPVHEYNLGAYKIQQMFAVMSGMEFYLEDIVDYHYNGAKTLIQVDLLFKRKE
jgi:FkbM family methyltransferase